MSVNHLALPGEEKEKGLQFFKEGDYLNASKSFSKALLAFNHIIREQKFESYEQSKQMTEEIQLPCLLNLAACYLKMKMGYSNVVVHCSDALKIQENNVKALYRRAIAYTNMDQFQDAKEDIDLAESLDPNNPDIQRIRSELVRRKTAYLEKTKKIAKKFFNTSTEGQQVPEVEKVYVETEKVSRWSKCFCCRRKTKTN